MVASSFSLLGLPSAVLGAFWPPERTMMGRRVCKLLRDQLVHSSRVTLVKSVGFEFDEGEESEDEEKDACVERIIEDLQLMANCQLCVRWSGREVGVLLRAMQRGCVSSLSSLSLCKCYVLKMGPKGSTWRDSDELTAELGTLAKCEALVHLDLSDGCATGVELSEPLRCCTALAHLNLRKNSIRALGASKLAETLPHLTNLVQLDLSENSLGWTNNLYAPTTEPDGVRKLMEALGHCTSLSFLHLGRTALSDAAGVVLGASLIRCTALALLDVSHTNMATAGCESLGRMLHDARAITHLNLNDNRLGPDQLERLCFGLGQCDTVTNLNLGNCHLDLHRAPPALQALFGRTLRGCRAMRSLDLSDNILGDGMLQAAEGLRAMTDLRQLGLSACGLGDQGAEIVAGLLPHLTCLTALDLSLDNGVAQWGATALAASLPRADALRQLQLQGNPLGDEGVARLAGVLGGCSALTSLNLSGVEMGLVGLELLSRALGACEGLAALYLSDNKIGKGGAKLLAQGFAECCTLTRLDLMETKIGPEAAALLAVGMAKCTTLRRVGLSDNAIRAEGGRALAGWIRECGSLVRLDLKSCRLQAGGAWEVVRAGVGCSTLGVLGLEDNGVGARTCCAMEEVGRAEGCEVRVGKQRSRFEGKQRPCVAEDLEDEEREEELEMGGPEWWWARAN